MQIHGIRLSDAAKIALAAVGIDSEKVVKETKGEKVDVSKFLNRLLGVPVDMQNSLFHFFETEYDRQVNTAKKKGEFAKGVCDIGGQCKLINFTETADHKMLYVDHKSGAETRYYKFTSNRGVSWEMAQNMAKNITSHPPSVIEDQDVIWVKNDNSGVPIGTGAAAPAPQNQGRHTIALEKSDTERTYFDESVKPKGDVKDKLRMMGARFDSMSRRWYVPPMIDLAPFADWLVERQYLVIKSGDTWLAEKEKVKELGACWSALQKQWFVPPGMDVEPFKKWIKEPRESDDVLEAEPQAAASPMSNRLGQIDVDAPATSPMFERLVQIDLDAPAATDGAAAENEAADPFARWACVERWRVVYQCPRAQMALDNNILLGRLQQGRKELEDLKSKHKKMVKEFDFEKKGEKRQKLQAHLSWINIRNEELDKAFKQFAAAKVAAVAAVGEAKDVALGDQLHAQDHLDKVKKDFRYGLTTFVDNSIAQRTVAEYNMNNQGNSWLTPLLTQAEQQSTTIDIDGAMNSYDAMVSTLAEEYQASTTALRAAVYHSAWRTGPQLENYWMGPLRHGVKEPFQVNAGQDIFSSEITIRDGVRWIKCKDPKSYGNNYHWLPLTTPEGEPIVQCMSGIFAEIVGDLNVFTDPANNYSDNVVNDPIGWRPAIAWKTSLDGSVSDVKFIDSKAPGFVSQMPVSRMQSVPPVRYWRKKKPGWCKEKPGDKTPGKRSEGWQKRFWPVMSVQQRDPMRLASNLWMEPHHRLICPHTGEMNKLHLSDLQSRYVEITADQCEGMWKRVYEHSKHTCVDGPNCAHNLKEEDRAKRGKKKRPCKQGLSSVTKHMLAGSLLPVWDCIAPALTKHDHDGKTTSSLHISRLETEDGQRLVGVDLIDEISRTFILKGIEAKWAKDAEMQGYSRGDHIALDLDSSDDEPVVNDDDADDVDNFDY